MRENLFIVEHPLIKRDVTILRDKNTDSETFRAALQRVSNILAAESKSFLESVSCAERLTVLVRHNEKNSLRMKKIHLNTKQVTGRSWFFQRSVPK